MTEFFREDEYRPGYSLEDKIVFSSIAASGVIAMIGLFLYLSGSTRVGGMMLLLGLMIGVVPYGIFSFIKNRAVREMENQFPIFLQDLAESKRGGMTILRAFESARESDYGRLNKQIERVHQELTWGIPFPEVMERFSRRLEESTVIQESISIIIQSFESGGNITDTIEAVADDSSQLKEVIQEKNAKLKQQLVIMYTIYFLFIGITIGVYIILSNLLGLGEPGKGLVAQVSQVLGGGGGGGASSVNYCSGNIGAAKPFCSTAKIFGFIPGNITDLGSQYARKFDYGRMAYYKSLLFTMLMIQGGCTAAVAGQVGEGSPSAGVKHAIIMLPLAFVAYMFVVAPMGV